MREVVKREYDTSDASDTSFQTHIGKIKFYF